MPKGPTAAQLTTRSALVAAAALAAGCGSTRAAMLPLAPPKLIGEPWASICRPVMGGADLTLEAAENGASLTLAAAPTMAEDVFDRVLRLGAGLSAEKSGESQRAEGAEPPLPHVRVSVVAVYGGARATFEVRDPGEATLLRTRLAALVEQLRSGGCAPLPPPLGPERPTPSPPPVATPSGHHH